MRWVSQRDRCKICNGVIVYDDWEEGTRKICTFCEAEYGEEEIEKKEGEKDE